MPKGKKYNPEFGTIFDINVLPLPSEARKWEYDNSNGQITSEDIEGRIRRRRILHNNGARGVTDSNYNGKYTSGE